MSQRRTAAKVIRFRPDELAVITECARACGQTPARFIRETALGVRPKARHHAAAEPLLRDLARIGRSLDQLTRVAQASHHPELVERASAALDRHWALVGQLLERRRKTAGEGAP